MSKKEKFIELVEQMLEEANLLTTDKDIAEALEYFEELKSNKTSKAQVITEKGIKIISYMQEEYEKHNNMFKASDIGAGIFLSGRSVASSMRKLVTDGYVSKIKGEPTVYQLTEKGKETKVD